MKECAETSSDEYIGCSCQTAVDDGDFLPKISDDENTQEGGGGQTENCPRSANVFSGHLKPLSGLIRTANL